jgi:hypothetical protein
LKNSLADSSGVALAMMRDRKLIELVLQGRKFNIEVGSLTCELFAGLPLGAQETEHKATP